MSTRRWAILLGDRHLTAEVRHDGHVEVGGWPEQAPGAEQ